MKKLLIILLSLLPTQLIGQTPAPGLSRAEAEGMARDHYIQAITSYTALIDANWREGVLRSGEYSMPYAYYVSGDIPTDGYPLYISLHGGGGTTAEENDQQWENQQSLYGAVDGVYFVPRAPLDVWDMWHQAYMDDFIAQIINYSVMHLGVNVSRVYLLGYSAGGDGVYNLATRLSDKFAAAAMMAGHPGDAQIENLRNLPFAMYIGQNDTAYNRSGLAVEWLMEYQRLNGKDPNGFEYNINIFEGKGHWMDGLDGAAINWLAEHRRVGNPDKIIWIQDDVLHTHKYNLEVSEPKQGFRVEQRVDSANNTIYITTTDYNSITIWLDDYIANLDNPVRVILNGQKVFEGIVIREEQNIIESLNSHLDPEYIFWGKVTLNLR